MALEITGFVFTTAALATLFDACVNSLDRIAAYRSFDDEFDGYRSRYALQRQILHDWGARAGIQGGKLLSNHSPLLDEAERLKAVGNALENIEKTLKTGTALVETYATALREPSGRHGLRIKDSMRSKSRKMGWSTFGKRSIKENVDQLTSLVAYVLQAVPADHMDTAPTYKQQVTAWLGAPATHDTLVDTANGRLAGTCKWIFENNVVKAWLDPQDKCARVLWINGSAGFGKTYLASALVERLEHEHPETTFHFFCSHEKTERRSPLSILKSWIAQAISRSSRTLGIVNKIRVATGQPQALKSDVWSAFREMVRSMGPVTLTIDGYDECINIQDGYQTTDSRADFLRALLEELSGTRTRLLITSREEGFIREPLNGARKSMILRNFQVDDYTITQTDVKSDIEALAHLMVNAELLSRSFVDRQEVVDQMVRKADGMFLWLRLCQDNIKDWKSLEQLKIDIDATPSKLERAYGRTIQDIQDSEGADKERAFQIFRLVLFAVEPLTVGQLTEALVMIDSPDIDRFPITKLPIAFTEQFVQDYILRPCHSLLEVRGEADDQKIKTKTIHFRHFSVKEFFLKRHHLEPGHAAGDFSYSHAQEHLEFLGNLCLRYLLLQDFVIEGEFTTDHDERLNERYVFLRYAASAWRDHIGEICKAQDVSRARVKLLMCSKGSFNTWEYVFRQFLASHIGGLISSRGFPLHYAVLFGDLDTVKALLDRGDDVNDIGGLFGDAVQAGCYGGRSQFSEIVELLLEHGATQHTGVGLFGSALHACTAGKHDAVLRLLLGRGWDPLVKNSDGKTSLCLAAEIGRITAFEIILAGRASQDLTEDSLKAAYVQDLQAAASKGIALLYAAAEEGNIGILDLLFQHGADLEAVGSEIRTVLYRSCVSGQEAVVTWLLEHGANMDYATPENGFTALHVAVIEGNSSIVGLLLDNHANVDAKNQSGATALHMAVVEGNSSITGLLLDNHANVDAKYQSGATALHMAVVEGNSSIVGLLLDNHANVDAKDENGVTALHAAVIEGNSSIVGLLLDNHAIVDAKDESGVTALHRAVAKGNSSIVGLLLDNHANVDAKIQSGATALHMAVVEGNSSIVGLLLDNHANVDAKIQSGATALHMAVVEGNSSIVGLLLDNHANVDAKNQSGATALHMAVVEGNSSIVGLLLDNHANADAPNADGHAPIHLTALAGHESIMRTLLDRGGDIGAQNENGSTALHAAALKGTPTLVSLLLGYHANASAVTKFGGTPLHLASSRGDESIVQILLSHGADSSLLDFYGKTAYDRAKEEGHVSCLEALRVTETTKMEAKQRSKEARSVPSQSLTLRQKFSRWKSKPSDPS